MSEVRLRLLGESLIHVDANMLEPSATHLFALMLYLSVERGKFISRQTLVNLLFPDARCAQSSHNLRQLLYRLRRIGAPLKCTPSTVFIPGERVVEHPENELGREHRDGVPGVLDSYVVLPSYEPPTPALSSWLESYRENLSLQFQRRLSLDLQASRKIGNWDVVGRLARGLLELDPLNETATLCLAEVIARTGSKYKAISLLHRYEEDAGRLDPAIALPSRLLKKRIESAPSSGVGDLPECPLIGRQAELSFLAEQWSNAVEGNFVALVVTGEPSIGKTRLVAELLSMIRMDASGAIVSSRRLAADRDRPLSLFADVTKHLMCLPGAAGCSPENVQILLRLTETPTTGSRRDLDHLTDTYQRVRASLLELLDCVASERPLVLAIEDAHFLDDASLTLLEQMLEQSPGIPMLALLSGARTEAQLTGARRLHLSPLEPDALRMMAWRLTSADSSESRDEDLDWLCSVAAGNPGHLELLVSTARCVGTHRVPKSLVALADERIAGLSALARHTLCAIAIIGSDCSVDLIAKLTGIEPYALLQALQGLETSCLIVASRDGGVRCRSLLVQERVIAVSALSVKQLLHARAARAIRLAVKSGSFSQAAAWRIAEHWLAAADPLRARIWQRRCWHHSIAIGQPTMAAASVALALESAQTPRDRASLLDELARAIRSTDDTVSLIATLTERLALCEPCEDVPSTRNAISFDLIDAHLRNYDDDATHLANLRVLLRSGQLDDRRRIRAARLLLIVAHNMLNVELATEAHAVNCSLRAPDDESRLMQGTGLLIYHTVFGDRDHALRQADHLTELAKNSTLLWERLVAIMNVALARWNVDSRQLDHSQHIEAFGQACRSGAYRIALHLASQLATFLFEDGQLESARDWGRRAMELDATHHFQTHPMDFLCSQASLAMWAGESQEALRLIDLMPVLSPKSRSGLTENAAFVFRLTHKQMCLNKPLDETELERLLESHAMLKTFGKHDYHVETLWTALSEAGRGPEAHALLTEYLTFSRRERRRPNYSLRVRTDADSHWRHAGAQLGYTPSDTFQHGRKSPE